MNNTDWSRWMRLGRNVNIFVCVSVCVDEKEIRRRASVICNRSLACIWRHSILFLLLARLGSKNFNYSELSEQISLKTGGLNVSTHLEESPFRLDEYEEVSWTSLGVAEIPDIHTCSGNSTVLVLSRSQYRCDVRSLGRRSAPFHVSQTTFSPVRCHRTDSFPPNSEQLNQFDRLKTLIKGQASSYANSVHESGHTFAVMHSASQYGPVDQMSENLFGITQVNRMQEIARLENFDEIVKQLIEIGNHVLKKSSLRFVSFRHCLQFLIHSIDV